MRRGHETVPLLFGRELLAMNRRERDRWTTVAFEYWRRQGFPYPTFSHSVARREIRLLESIHARHLARVLSRPSMVGLQTANSFHPQMWSARVRGRSPVECFCDDRLLRKCLERAIRFWPDRRCWNARSVRILVSIQNRGRVSNFRPSVARALIRTFAPTDGRIVDFSAGYGGRLLASLVCKCEYFGVDPARAQCAGLRKMARALDGKASIIRGCAEDVMPTFRSKSVDLVFSSPPYFRLEKYSEETSQVWLRHKTYDQWLSRFLEPVLVESHRTLKTSGHLLLNVADTAAHSIATDALRIARDVFGAPVRTYHMAMSTNPADKARSGRLLKTEPIFVFRR
jgi:hypothetical protein